MTLLLSDWVMPNHQKHLLKLYKTIDSMDVFRNHLFKQTSRFTKPVPCSQNAPNLSDVVLHPDGGPCDGKTTSAGAGLGLEGDKIKSRHRSLWEC